MSQQDLWFSCPLDECDHRIENGGRDELKEAGKAHLKQEHPERFPADKDYSDETGGSREGYVGYMAAFGIMTTKSDDDSE
jgi:hypothetical protein